MTCRLTHEQIQETYLVRKLKTEDVVKGFDCGDEDLNDYITNDAQRYRKALLSVTYVIEDKNTQHIVAYYSLAADSISINSFPTKTEFNRFRKHRFVNEKRIKSYPAIKLCRLGTSTDVRGLGIGTFIVDFIKYSLVHNMNHGCRFLTVDAYNAAVGFYTANGFEFLTEEERHANRPLLYFDLNDIT